MNNRLDKTCPWCKNTFAFPIKKPKQVCCSLSCAAKLRYYTDNKKPIISFKKIRKEKKSDYLCQKGGKRIHRIVAEKKIGRKLLPDEHVHHIDGNHLNNSPDNLQIMEAKEHRRLHAFERL